MPSSRINRSIGVGDQNTVTDPDHPDYLTKCPLPIRVKLAGKQLFQELEGYYQFGDHEDDFVDKAIRTIVREHAIPLPIQVLEYARSMFVTKRLNPKNEKTEIGDISVGSVSPGVTPLGPDVFNESDDIVKHCIDLLNKRIDG